MDCIPSISLFRNIIPNYNMISFNEAKKWLIDEHIIGNKSKIGGISYRVPT